MPVIAAVCRSERTGTVKEPVKAGRLVADFGLEGDAHAGTERQVSLLCRDSVRKLEGRGVDLPPGVFAENLLVDGLRIEQVQVGQAYALPSGALLEVTRIGKTCHSACAIRTLVGDCVMPREGFFARVAKAGEVRPGDSLVKVREAGASPPLPAGEGRG
jgi:MOSC domain-containing protein YiiM